ncbi:MAG: glutathione S-transferase family protein [Burkholderiales bacterium]
MQITLPRHPVVKLVSHHLCPYVQRAAIVLAEKGVAFEREYVDLARKPGWFSALSPLGKVPLLQVGGEVLFESAVICEYLEDTAGPPLHPADPLLRARHRAWMEFGSAILNVIAGFYNAPDAAALEAKRADLQLKFELLEQQLGAGPYFAGEKFSIVDAVFGPVYRYFDVFDTIGDFEVFTNTPKVRAWRRKLAARPSVRAAALPDYEKRLREFLLARGSALSAQMRRAEPVSQWP